LKRKAPLSPYEAQKAAAKRAALNALKRAKRLADKAGVKLSEWEGEFLGSVSERVKTYGRAFGDPEKGAPGQALSAMQAVKLNSQRVDVPKGDPGEAVDAKLMSQYTCTQAEELEPYEQHVVALLRSYLQ